MMRGPALGIVALLLAGCGGAGSSPTGLIAIRVAWPAKAGGRVVPAAAQSVQVQLVQNATVTHTAILSPSSATTTFTEVPLGNVTVKAVAFPTAGATGTPMASGQTVQTVSAGSPVNVSLTMASTIDRLTISPSPITLALSGVFSRQITVTAYDVSNAVVLTAPTDVSYATTNSLLFDVSATGLVRGLAVGSATVTATDASSGKSATASVVVTL